MSDRRSADTRQKILEVSEREFAKDGYAGAHLQRIASQVGVQKTALYYYFPSKEALYEAVLVGMLQSFDQMVTEALSRDGTHAERLARLLDAMNDLLAERRNYAQILMRIFVDRVPLSTQEVTPYIGRVVGSILSFAKEGMEAGEFVRCSSRHLFQTVLGSTVFHYATGEFGAAVLDVDDIFSHSAVSWRRDELRRAALRAILASPPSDG
jgi:TetR/AcrR family transcriptional regulator